MKKYSLFAIFLAMMALLLSACGKMPEDDMKWYPADYADSAIQSLDISRTPGKCLEGGVTLYTPQGEWYQSRWKSGEDAPTVQAHEPAQGGPPPADGLTVAALRKLVEQADRWVWEEKGHDTEYHLSGLLYSAESLSIPGAPADFDVRRDLFGLHRGAHRAGQGFQRSRWLYWLCGHPKPQIGVLLRQRRHGDVLSDLYHPVTLKSPAKRRSFLEQLPLRKGGLLP